MLQRPRRINLSPGGVASNRMMKQIHYIAWIWLSILRDAGRRVYKEMGPRCDKGRL